MLSRSQNTGAGEKSLCAIALRRHSEGRWHPPRLPTDRCPPRGRTAKSRIAVTCRCASCLLDENADWTGWHQPGHWARTAARLRTRAKEPAPQAGPDELFRVRHRQRTRQRRIHRLENPGTGAASCRKHHHQDREPRRLANGAQGLPRFHCHHGLSRLDGSVAWRRLL